MSILDNLSAEEQLPILEKGIEALTATVHALEKTVEMEQAIADSFNEQLDQFYFGFLRGMDKELEDVRDFHDKFGILNSERVPTMLTRRKLTERAECMQEELDEFKAAIASQDFAEQADALIDLVYFVKGTAVMMGLPWEDLWDDVQRANISKVRGMTKRGHAVDVTKPTGWVKPQTMEILLDHGFNAEDFQTDGVVDEGKCLDDPVVATEESAKE
jgi:predicted HAD superfamily Cof-like phosphohydrolase